MEEKCFIWDEGFPKSVWGEQNNVITNQEKLTSFDFSKVDSIYVLAELEWANKERSDFFGIELVQQLRLQNINKPVIVCSFVPRDVLIKQYRFDILRFTRGHGFIHLPDSKTVSNDDSIEPLSKLEMLDVQFHFCSLEGAISRIYHRKQNAGSDIESAKAFLIKMLNEIKNITGSLETIKKIIDHDITQVQNICNKTDLDTFIEKPVTHITSYLQKENNIKKETVLNNSNFITKEGNWEVLLLDDEPETEIIQNIINSLKQSHTTVHIAKNVVEAKKIINDDIFNFISVVISDYRIENNIDIIGEQGYDFVQWLSTQSRFNAIFVLSGLDRHFIKQLFKSYSIKVHPQNKNELSSKYLTDYINDVLEAGNNEYNCILNMPTSGYWDPHIRSFYSHYRAIPDHDNIEHKVSLRARRIINELEVFFSLKPNNNWFHKLLKEGPVITPGNQLTTRLFDQKTNNTLKVTDKSWKAFLEVLVYRRVALYLFTQKNMSRGFVSGLINKGKYINDSSEKLVFSCLGLSKFDFPHYVLIEELNWFKTYLDIDPNNRNITNQESIIYFERIILEIEDLLNENFDISKSKIDNLIKNEATSNLNPNTVLFSIGSNEHEDKKRISTSKKSSTKMRIKIHCQTVNKLIHIIEMIKNWGLKSENDYLELIDNKVKELINQGILYKN